MALDILGPATPDAVTVRPSRSTTRGAADTWFKDCSSPTAEDGTEIPADILNDWLAQFRTLFDGAGIVEDNADDMLLRAVQSIGIRYAVDQSTVAGQIVAQFSPPVKALTIPLLLVVKVAHDVPGTGTTLQADTMSTQAVVRNDGFGTALAANDLRAGQHAFVMFDGTNYKLLSGGAVSLQSAAQQQPIYPEITSANNVFSASLIAAGQVVLASGLKWVHRGLNQYVSDVAFSSGDRSFAVAASKTYHLRWYAPGTGRATPTASFPNGRLYAEDLSDHVTYNPAALAETDRSFDTTYDNMLFAKVVTDAAAAPTVTWLINRMFLAASFTDNVTGGAGSVEIGYGVADPQTVLTETASPRIVFDDRLPVTVGLTGNGSGYCVSRFALNWARTPSTYPCSALVGYQTQPGGTPQSPTYVEGGQNTSRTVDRYSVRVMGQTDYNLFGIVNASNAFTLGACYAVITADVAANK